MGQQTVNWNLKGADFYHTFFDTLCWAEGRRCALSHHRTVVAWCLIERRVRQRKVEHAHDAVRPGTGLAALPQPPRRLRHNTMSRSREIRGRRADQANKVISHRNRNHHSVPTDDTAHSVSPMGSCLAASRNLSLPHRRFHTKWT